MIEAVRPENGRAIESFPDCLPNARGIQGAGYVSNKKTPRADSTEGFAVF